VVDSFDNRNPAPVVEGAAEFADPWAQTVGHAIGNPDAQLGFVGNRVFPAVFIVDADAGNSDNGLSAEGSSKFLAVLAVGPGRGKAVARLAVGEEGWGELAGGLHGEGSHGSAAGVGDEAGAGIELADFTIPESPEIEQTLVGPFDPLEVGRI